MFGARPAHMVRAAAIAAAAMMLMGSAAQHADAVPDASRAPSQYPGFQGEWGMPADYDRRPGTVAPTTRQLELVRAMDATVRWNRFGTPLSLIDHDGYLDSGLSGAPAVAARRWIAAHRDLFRLSESGVAALELMHDISLGNSGAHVVLFRQTFAGMPAAVDGRITLGIVAGKLAYVSSSAAGVDSAPVAPALTPDDAVRIAAADAGRVLPGGAVSKPRREDDWTVFDVSVLSEPVRARLRALPFPDGRVVPVYETLIIDNHHGRGHPIGFVHFIDAVTGDPVIRQNRLNFREPPYWEVFPANPPLSYKNNDTRAFWCWNGGKDCALDAENKAAGLAWDLDPFSDRSTHTTWGNAAVTGQSWASPYTPAEQYRPVSATREYSFAWTNQWYEEDCSPHVFLTPERNDIDAATTNLFVMHNRMHDWSYRLGFTEAAYNLQQENRDTGDEPARGGDPEVGNSQAGAAPGSASPLVGRDNANQITPQDGVSPITNMYLWQPIAAAFYPPCADGDYDMAVIGHEYTHAISNRMVAGPDEGLSGAQAGAMGESWSDLVAMEYLNEYGFVPVADENPWAVGVYVTGDPDSAVRNYGMNRSPLNYSNVAYDFVGQQVHADGEIWSAVNFSIRKAFNDRYDRSFPSSSKALQRACADGERGPQRCPGNRRWIQILFDAFLLMESRVSMLDARDAYLAADRMRFGGANQDLLWREFARRGLGKGAESKDTGDADPDPSFVDPKGPNGKVTFDASGLSRKARRQVKVYVGHYEARSIPIAEGKRLRATMAPGSYDFVAVAPGYGHRRFSARVAPGRQTVGFTMRRNLAARVNGAKATGDGVNHVLLIDETEATNWESTDKLVRGVNVVVDLAGGAHRIDSVNVSAMLDVSGDNRFSALRSFALEVCRARSKEDCAKDGDFRRIYRSPGDAFPVVPPRSKAPHLILRSFDVPDAVATHVRLVALTNQCMGVKEFRQDYDKDPSNDGSCISGLPPLIPPQDDIVKAAEFQVFGDA